MSESDATTNQPGNLSEHALPGTGDGPESDSSGDGELPAANAGQGDNSAQDLARQEGNEPKRPAWETAETLEDYWYTRKEFFTDAERARAWEETANIVKTYSEEMVVRWNAKIDTLLVYGGLFSAVLTAFNVQSYQLLTPPPATDPVIVALERISAQLSSFSVNPPSVNATHPAFVYHDPTPLPALRYAVWLNALWFASLIFSLSAASIGIMVKQWLNEYSTGLSGKSRQIARLRQLRLNSLQQWRVKEIVAVLPVLLQIASALFFAGLLVLLWQLNRTVAITATCLISALTVFSVSTIMLPSFTAHCSYLSPPSRALYALTRPLKNLFNRWRAQVSDQMAKYYLSDSAWWVRSFSIPRKMFRDSHPCMYRVWNLIDPGETWVTLSWQGKELALLTSQRSALDGDAIATAYTTVMDTKYLHHASICITEIPLPAARQCVLAIRSANTAHWGEDGHAHAMHSVHPCMWSGAIVSLASQDSLRTSPSIAQELKDMYTSMFPGNSYVLSALSHTRLVNIDFARILRHYDQDELPPGTIKIAEKILFYDLKNLMSCSRERHLGNDVRRQVILACAQKVPPGWNSTQTEVRKIKEALMAITCTIYCASSQESSDGKPDDPEYQALRAQVSRTLEEFSHFLTTRAAVDLAVNVDGVFDGLYAPGEKAGLLFPSLIRAMAGYLDAFKNAPDQLSWEYVKGHEEWIRPLYRKLKPADSEQNPSLVVAVASTSVDTDDLENPQAQLTFAAADTTTNHASTAIPSAQSTSSARPEGSYPEVLPLTSFPAPSSTPIQEFAFEEPTPSAPRSEDSPAPQEDPFPARANPDEVSETPAPVGLCGTSNDVNPQETESSSTVVSLTPQCAVEHSSSIAE